MRLLCFALISSDWIENCPVSNNRTRQKYDRLDLKGAGDTCVSYNRHGGNMSPVFLWKAKCAFKEEMAHTLLSLVAQQATMVCPRLRSRWGKSCQTFNFFSPKKSCQTFNFFFRKSCHCFNFISENLVKLSTFFPQKILSNFQLFYFNYCYNEASRLGALSRYQIKREETSDEGGVLIQSQKEHEF